MIKAQFTRPVVLSGVLSLFLLSAARLLWAGGLSLPYAEFRVERLVPGYTYTGSRDVLKDQYAITNKMDETIDVGVSAYVPSPEQLQKGYEAIPDASWFVFANPYFSAEPTQRGSTEFYVSIPKDPALAGRKFQVQLVAQTLGSPSGSGFVRLGLGGRAFLHVDGEAVPGTPEEKERQLAVRFVMDPHFIYAEDVPLGKTLRLSELMGQMAFVRNDSDEPLKVALRVVSLRESFVQPPQKYEELKDLKALKVSRKLSIPAHGRTEITGKFRLKDVPENKDKKFYIVIELKSLDKRAPVTKYGRLFIHTRP